MSGRTKLITALVCSAACTRAVYEPQLHPITAIPSAERVSPQPLTAHLHSGDVIVFARWAETDSGLVGSGNRFNAERQFLRVADWYLPLDSVALLETEVRAGSRPTGVTGMVVWSVIWGATTIACVADPKSCFGSCPTFYVAGDSGQVLAAEGFSGSIARVLERADTDALFPARATSGPFTITMRNEALETHAVRDLRLIAARRPPGGRVFAGPDDHLYPASTLRGALTCDGPEGSCLGDLARLDSRQRTSTPDSTDLAARETIELTFPAARGRLGLVLAGRQSLMSTYLLYQTMGFLGRQAGATLAAIERMGPAEASRVMGMADLIGRIAIDVWDGQSWQHVADHDEAGPLATEVRVFPFSHSARGPVRIRLTAARGAWRLDWVSLASIGERVEHLVLAPTVVARAGAPDTAALARLLAPDAHLITYPGDAYQITFDLPEDDASWELFLRSEGFYYEWMRSEWFDDEDADLATMTLSDPAGALRMLAPGFARAVPQLEREFWSSRVGRQP